MCDKTDDFVLKSNEAFDQRRKNVFDQLSTIEKNLKNTGIEPIETMEIDQDFCGRKRPPAAHTKHFRGKESIFKRPRDPITKDFIRKMPDFKKNPHKWTKYTLDDVRDEDISDKGNTRAALSFMNELRSRRSIENQNDNKIIEEEPQKIVFRKRTIVPAEPNKHEEDDKATFKSSKVVMPEYVVGQKLKRDKRNKGTKSNEERNEQKRKELKLNHLYEEDE